MGRGTVVVSDGADFRISFPIGTVIEARRHLLEAGEYHFDVSHPNLPNMPGYPHVTTDGETWKIV